MNHCINRFQWSKLYKKYLKGDSTEQECSKNIKAAEELCPVTSVQFKEGKRDLNII